VLSALDKNHVASPRRMLFAVIGDSEDRGF